MELNKAAIAGNYIAQQLAWHGHKRLRQRRIAAVIGARDGNIGDAIAMELERSSCTVLRLDRETGFDARTDALICDADILVLAQGSMHLDWIEDQPEDAMRRVLDDVLFASMRMTTQFVQQTVDAPHLKYIIYVGSIAHCRVLNASAPYCAAKAGLNMFAKAAAWELAPKGYRVFIVHPSNVEGAPMSEQTIQELMRVRDVDRATAEAYWGALNVMPRWLSADDIARVVAELADGQHDHLSGASLEFWAGQR